MLRLRNIAGALTEKESICKYYFIDNGFLNLFLLDGESSLLENMVAIELFRRFGHDPENDTVYFYNAGEEVDFYIPEEKTGIQACYSTSKDITTFERELNALISLDKVHPLDRMIIVTYDEDRTHKTSSGKEIEIIPLWKWLLR